MVNVNGRNHGVKTMNFYVHFKQGLGLGVDSQGL
jgi:hypothetical protein